MFMRSLLFQDVMQNWLVVELPMFGDSLSVPSSRVRLDCLAFKDFTSIVAEAWNCVYCVHVCISRVHGGGNDSNNIPFMRELIADCI